MFSLRLSPLNLSELKLCHVTLVTKKVIISLPLCDKAKVQDFTITEWLSYELVEYYSAMIDRGLNWMISDLHMHDKSCSTGKILFGCDSERCLLDEKI